MKGRGGDFKGIVFVEKKSILKKSKEEILAVADDELKSFSVCFKKELMKYWDKLHQPGKKK